MCLTTYPLNFSGFLFFSSLSCFPKIGREKRPYAVTINRKMSISCVILRWAVLNAAWKSAPVHRATISQVNTWGYFWLDFRQSVFPTIHFPFKQAVSIASHEKWCMWHRIWKAKQTLHNLDDWMTIKLIACCVVDVEQRRRRRHCHLSTTSFVRRKSAEEIECSKRSDRYAKEKNDSRGRERERKKKVTWKVCLCSNKHVNCIYTKYDGDLLLFFLFFLLFHVDWTWASASNVHIVALRRRQLHRYRSSSWRNE